MNIAKRFRKNGKNGLAKAENSTVGQEITGAFDRMRRFFEEPWSFSGELVPWPAVDVTEDEKALTLRVDVPGIEAKDIEVEVSDNLLTVRGSRDEEKESKNAGVWRHERKSGSFVRTLTLPTYVESAKVEAKCEKGVLTITAPKVAGAAPKRVEVKAS